MTGDRSRLVVGRDAELAMAREALASVISGASKTLLIEGEAGIGKSQLVDRIAEDAAAMRVPVTIGVAHVFERNRPFGVLADALDLRPRSRDPRRARIALLLNANSDAPASKMRAPLADARFRIFEEIVDLIDSTCADTPLVLVLEDLHWADESSLGAIGAIVHELAHVPLLLVATLRPAPRMAALDFLIDDCLAAAAQMVQLRPLFPDEVEKLVADQLGVRAGPVLSSIVARAGGNPLLIVELLRSLSSEGWLRKSDDAVEAVADELPNTLRDLVLRRLRYLPSRALDVLQLAAVFGESVSVEDLAVASSRPSRDVAADLSEAFRARLLDARDDAVVFRHQLVQQAIYEDLPVPVRGALHREAAGALAHSGADLSRVASHLLRGAKRGDLEAVHWLRRAATEASAGAPSVAVDLIRHAGELLPPRHDETDIVSSELAAALLRAGRVAESAEIAESILSRPHRDEADVPLQLTLVDALSLQNRGPELIVRANAAFASPALGPADRALVLAQASFGQSFSGDFVGGEATAHRAREFAVRVGSTAMTVWSLCAGSLAVKTQGRYGEALSMTRRAVDAAFEPIDYEARLRHPHFFLGMALADSDRFDEARVAYGHAIAEAEELGTAWLLPDMLALAGERRFLIGEWDDAWTELEAAVSLAEQQGQRISIPQSRAYQALIAAGRGDVPTARALLVDLEPTLRDPTPPYGTEIVALAMAVLAESSGDAEGAFDVLLRLWHHDAERTIRYYHRFLSPPLVRIGLASGRRAVVEGVVAMVEEGAALASDVPTVQSAALRCRGLLDRDPEALLEAVEHSRAGHRVLEHAGTCEDAAEVLASVGRHGDAKDLLVEACERYEDLEASSWAGRVAAELRRLGVRRGARGTRRRPASGWASLTGSEQAVSRLVAEGLTNREVARRLHVSPHTVNTHLRHVFQKMSVTTRAQLAAEIARHSLITQSSDVLPTGRRAF